MLTGTFAAPAAYNPVTEGIGGCQRRGGPVEVNRPGDRVLFEAGKEHWHGAQHPTGLWSTSRSTRATDQHDVVQWLHPVTDDESATAPIPTENAR